MVDGQSQKKTGRIRNFYLRYLELCRTKNFPALSEIKPKNNNNSILDFFGDKFKIDDWLFIIDSLYFDQTLQNISIRLRKNWIYVLENIDTEKRARLFKNKPVIFTKFIFLGVIEAVSNCLKCNKNLNTLALEALPLTEKYSANIAKALATNETLQTISFCRSSIGDNGCEVLCNAIKCLPHIENVYMCNCNITVQGAVHIADMIKFQKIYRYSEGWKNSLRYRDVDPDSIPGLKMIFIAQNPKIGDDGTELITEILKEDVWIKVIDMEDCGLTDIGAKYIFECLKLNQALIEFSIRGNPEINPEMVRLIKTQLGKYSDNADSQEKMTNTNIREQMKLLEEQLAAEKQLRKQVELLNEQLHEQIMFYEKQLREKQTMYTPDGFILLEQETWDSVVKERDELTRALAIIKAAKSRPHVKKTKVRKAKSEINSTLVYERCRNKCSKSEHGILNSDKTTRHKDANTRVFIEKSIGDTHQIESKKPANLMHYQDITQNQGMMGIDALKVFMNKKPESNSEDYGRSVTQETARSLFMGN